MPAVFKHDMTTRTDLPPELLIENAWDPYHVEYVHASSVHACEVIAQGQDHAILLYTMRGPWFLPFLRKRFLVYKTRQRGVDRELRFLSFPVQVGLITYLRITAKKVEQHTELRQFFSVRLKWPLSLMGNLLLKMRNKGEAARWKEDEALIRLRHQSLKAGHRDNPSCLAKEELVVKWFGK